MIKKAFSTIRWLFVVVMCLTSSLALAEDENHFDLWELRVKGNTLLDRKTIERSEERRVGKEC